jgi:hypothetical protein
MGLWMGVITVAAVVPCSAFVLSQERRPSPIFVWSGWNDIISSARRLSDGGGGVRPPIQPGLRGLELYSAPRFEGSRRVFTDEVSNLQSVGFNDVAMSLRVGRGESWQVCVHEGYRDCRVMNTDWSDLT